ncbi:hypothetical protein TrVGV298_005544 [Trichoderma virens]|nr:hypothetical protein TrVGV298_005544 [Trichoderma virens]
MAKTKNALAVASKAIDPTLDALFASSAGPVTVPSKPRVGAPPVKTSSSTAKSTEEDGDDQGDDEVLSEISEELDYGDDDEEEAGDDSAENEDGEGSNDEDVMSVTMEVAETEENSNDVEQAKTQRDRKRKRKQDNDDLEGRYLAKLADDDEPEPSGKRLKGGEGDAQDSAKEGDDDEAPVHESLTQESKQSEVEKAARTVFLGNVATEAISSKTAKKELMKHLSSVLDKDASPPQKIESLRFRSVAFSTGSMPKRAAYITKALMDATTKSTNAYAVFSTPAAARKVVTELNGTEILGRHIRVDSVAHPSPMNHRNCVFVGNLGFVDDETVLNRKADGETVEKKRNKVPSDIEEGLWRTFGTQGKVENVRVVRDSKTRVGKGFAYVQFYDANDVEAALLLNGKKFPPMLPRELRVTRAKDPRKTAQAVERARSKADTADGASRSTKYKPKATPEEQAAAGRTRKLLGRSAAAKQRHAGRRSFPSAAKDGETADGIKTPEAIIFEGRRASSKDGLPKDLKMGKKNKKKAGRPMRPQNRSAKRAAAWKKK